MSWLKSVLDLIIRSFAGIVFFNFIYILVHFFYLIEHFHCCCLFNIHISQFLYLF